MFEPEEKNFQRSFSLAVASSCSYGDKVVVPHVLNKDAISKLGKRDTKWLKLLSGKKMFTREAIQVCDNLNPNGAKDSDTDTNKDLTDADFIEEDIYLINQARGPYWENIGPRS